MTELRQKWIDALRSGRYRQTRELFCEDTPKGKVYCAVGVLFEELPTCDARYDIMNKAGLDGEGLSWVFKMNDVERKTFNQIADALEGAGPFGGPPIRKYGK